MMSDAHISREEWEKFFSEGLPAAERMEMQARVLAHTAGCEACRAIQDRGQALRKAARDWAGAECGLEKAPEEGAYRLVAAAGGPAGRKPVSGFLAVDIDAAGGDAVFLDYTLEAGGCARRYAMNPEDGGRRLADDGGALALSLAGGRISVRFMDGALRCGASLRGGEERLALTMADGRAEAPLPPGDYCTLELDFRE